MLSVLDQHILLSVEIRIIYVIVVLFLFAMDILMHLDVVQILIALYYGLKTKQCLKTHLCYFYFRRPCSCDGIQ